MTMRFKSFLALCALMVIMTAVPLLAATPEESFKKSFPRYQLDSIAPTAMPGIYEVIVRGKIAYYATGAEYLITGSIFTADGKNLTQERTLQMQKSKLAGLPLDKALKIGSGPNIVIEVTDPDCSFCRKAAAFFAKRNDVTRHIFFYSNVSKDSDAKIREIFCAKDQAKAYEAAMAGKLDDMKFTPCKSEKADKLLKIHKEAGDKAGVMGMGTPLFLINGQPVLGADFPAIEKLLGGKKEKK
jgi:thiol:disulfide interchange protein DsbC